jgi:glycosyltransferase involved in cell wall biosynthesis
MNILILTEAFPPEIRSASHLLYELAEDLVEKGFQVTVITRFPKNYIDKIDKKYRAKLFFREKMSGINVIRLYSFSFLRHIPLIRGLSQFILSGLLAIGGILAGKQDIILAYSPPLPLGISAYLLGKIKKAPFIFNVQDIFPQSVIDLGLLKNKVLIKISEAMEKFIYKKARYITVHSDGNRENIISKNVNPEKIVTIHNWVDTDLIKSTESWDNSFRNKNNLNGRFVVSFAGVMGFAQGLDIVVNCAELLKSYKDILFLLVGDGVKKDGLMKKVEDIQLNNIKFLPLQPKEIYLSILYASDICLVTLDKNVKTPVVPAKLLNIMASGRPVVACMNLKGDAPKIIKAAKCGYCVEADDVKGFSEAILKLYNNTSLRDEFGKNGREYAVRHFSRKICIEKYEKLFLKACMMAKNKK